MNRSRSRDLSMWLEPPTKTIDVGTKIELGTVTEKNWVRPNGSGSVAGPKGLIGYWYMRESWERVPALQHGSHNQNSLYSESLIGTDPCVASRRTGSENVLVQNRPPALPGFRDWATHWCSTVVKRRSDQAQNWIRPKTWTENPRKSVVIVLERHRASYTGTTIRTRSKFSIGTNPCVGSRRTDSDWSNIEYRIRE